MGLFRRRRKEITEGDAVRVIDDKKFHLDVKIGTGCFGSVYAASVIDKHGRPAINRVAVKVVEHDRTSPETVLGEAKSMRHFQQHPNIVKFLSIHQDQNASWIVMGLYKLNLADFYNLKQWSMTNVERFDLLKQVNLGLVTIHGRGLVHRDLKPCNILVNPDPNRPFGIAYRIGDFGSCTRKGENPDNYLVYRSRFTELLGNSETDKASPMLDLWGLGMLLFHLYIGPNDNIQNEALRMAVDEFIDVTDSYDLTIILRGLLRVEKSLRWKSAEELHEYTETAIIKSEDNEKRLKRKNLLLLK